MYQKIFVAIDNSSTSRKALDEAIALACLVGGFVTLQAYVWPFTLMVVR
jgi:nucleotide-binding universal stress UspA family protein